MAAVVAVLPTAAARVRCTSLKSHLALAVLRDGRDTIEQLATMLKAVFVAYFLCDCRPDDITPYTDAEAEAALNRCIRRAERGEPLTPDAGEATLLERVIAIHDAQLASVPARRYLSAWEQLHRMPAEGIAWPLPTPTDAPKPQCCLKGNWNFSTLLRVRDIAAASRQRGVAHGYLILNTDETCRYTQTIPISTRPERGLLEFTSPTASPVRHAISRRL